MENSKENMHFDIRASRVTSIVSEAFSSWSPIRSTIFLSSVMYFFAVLRTHGGNVALKRRVCGLSVLAE